MTGGTTGPLSATGEKIFAELGCVHLPSQRLIQAAAPTCRESSASPCNSQTDAPSPPTKITFASASSIPAPSASKDIQPIMPTFQGLVSEEQVNALVAYVKSLAQQAGAQDQHSRGSRRRTRAPETGRATGSQVQ